MTEPQGMQEMPRYTCHKVVYALKIVAIEPNRDGGGVRITPEEGYAPFDVPREYVEKHKPVAGGYYVVYKDGYKSFSPGEAFEDGYTRI